MRNQSSGLGWWVWISTPERTKSAIQYITMRRLSRIIAVLASIAIAFVVFQTPYIQNRLSTPEQTSSKSKPARPLDIYSIPALQKTPFRQSSITMGRELSLNPSTRSRLFFFTDQFAPDKRVSGTITYPPKPGTYPVIVMLRGWADENVYYPGYGTKNSASYYARNGYIAIAPDFLGYGESDASSSDLAEARFQMNTTALSLLASLPSFQSELKKESYALDLDRVHMWGHSNGGQIALTVLAISGASYPTVLWAPVTIPFPENVLHYAGEMSDRGVLIRALVANFKKSYDPRLYSMTEYLTNIKAPLLVHQGSKDDSVPQEWNDTFVSRMRSLDKQIVYEVYPEADHNLRPNWQTVVEKDVEWFENNTPK